MTVDMDALLDTYVAHYRGRLRYVPEARGRTKWFVLGDDGRWQRDARSAGRYARTVCHDTSQRVWITTRDDALARRIDSYATSSRLEHLARGDPRLIGPLPPT